MRSQTHWIAALALLMLTACSKGGQLTLENGANSRVQQKGSPFVQVTQGGALVVQSGQTAATGVHAMVSIQPIAAKNLTGPDGTQVIINKATGFRR